MKRYRLLIATVLLTVSGYAHAQLPAFSGAKTLDSGPDPVGIGKDVPSGFVLTIALDPAFDPAWVIKDTVPADFDVVSLVASCGTATAGEKQNKKNGKGGPKLRPDKITWQLTGCDPSLPQSLQITVATDLNPGHARRGVAFFEPTECGPLALNDGAEVKGAEDFESSATLEVATCLVEGTEGCVDADNDGWSVDCSDCNDADPLVTPGAVELCGDTIDNDCDTQVDENCSVTKAHSAAPVEVWHQHAAAKKGKKKTHPSLLCCASGGTNSACKG